MRGVPGLLAFNAGELTPLMDSRTDQDKYALGCKTLQNMICLVQGPATRRGGTRYVANSKSNQEVWLSRFQFNRTQSYIIEWGNNYIRFYTQRGQLQSGGDPFEVVTPWTYAQLTTTDGTFALQMVQSGDVVYITHQSGTYPVYKLSRLGATNWTLAPVTFTGGPFQDVDPNNTAITVTPNHLGNMNAKGQLTTSTAVTLTANTAIFNAAHVGSLFWMEIIDFGQYAGFKTATAYTLGQMVQFDGNVYIAQNAATSGTNAPTHLEGTVSDGVVKWLYAHSGYGWILITAFTDTTHVNGTVMSRLPGDGTAGAADGSSEGNIAFTRYAFQSFNGVDGYPVAIDFYNKRLCLGMNRSIFCSTPGIFEDFTPKTGFQALDSNAINETVGLKEIEQIRWLSGNRDLLVGTDSFEFTLQNQSTNLVFGPSNTKTVPQTNVGSRLIQPIETNNATLYVELSGKRLREGKYNFQIDRYDGEDVSILSEHITELVIQDMALQRDHDPVIWMALGDGSLAGMTYNRDRNVIGWHRHALGGFDDVNKTTTPFVLSVESIASPLSNRDDVWMVVERFINGSTVRTIEFMDDFRLVDDGQQFGYYVDCGTTYNGAPATVISGLTWLIGQTVQVLADGGVHPPVVVDNTGTITLNYAASVVNIGLQYTSILQTMRIEFGANDGTAQTRLKTTGETVFRLYKTIGGSAGVNSKNIFPIPFRPRGLTVGSVIPLFTGDVVMTLGGGWDRDGFIFVQQENPLPMTVVGIYPRITTND